MTDAEKLAAEVRRAVYAWRRDHRPTTKCLDRELSNQLGIPVMVDPDAEEGALFLMRARAGLPWF
jgi:hypothetical protein